MGELILYCAVNSNICRGIKQIYCAWAPWFHHCLHHAVVLPFVVPVLSIVESIVRVRDKILKS